MIIERIIGITDVKASVWQNGNGKVRVSEQPLGYNAKPLGKSICYKFDSKSDALEGLRQRETKECFSGIVCISVGTAFIFNSVNNGLDNATEISLLLTGMALIRIGLGAASSAYHDYVAYKKVKSKTYDISSYIF